MSGKRILLVDDEPDIRTTLAHALEGENYAVDLAGTMGEAKAFLTTQTYDLVIADWKLPDGDGRLIADWAVELGAKTIVVSGYLSFMPGGRAQGHETLMKPLRLADLVASVKRSIGEVVSD